MAVEATLPPTTEDLHFDSSTASAVALAELILVYGKEKETQLFSRVRVGERLSLGRESDSGVCLADSGVSRKHAEIRIDGNRAEVLDTGSSNGTFVNGRRITQASLGHGAILRLGNTLAIFVQEGFGREDPSAGPTVALAGSSRAMQRLRGWLEQLSPRPIPLLVLGESGVGKECVAREVHRLSGRIGRFVALNCAALPAELAESELFGHAAGAFSGAAKSSEGLFAAADGGTLFLDEIGELPLALQPKLLRVLDDGEIRQLGRTDARRVNVRVVAATNRDLRAEVEAGRFRGDVHARLAGWTLDVPPLRSRKEDILALASLFLQQEAYKNSSNAASGGGAPELSILAAERLLLHPWPYNVRELKHEMSAAWTRSKGMDGGRAIQLHDLSPTVLGLVQPLAEAITAAAPDAETLLSTLALYDGNITRVANHFGCARQQIYRWAARYQIDLDEVRGPKA